MNGDWQLEDTVYIPFTTRAFATGIPTALVSGEVQIYEDASVTQITAAETLTVSLDTIAGFNMVSVAATAANGFGAGQSYTLILSAGTVDSVSVIGEVVGQFTIQAAPVNWDRVTAPTTAVDLSGTDIQLVDTVTTYTGNTVQTGDTYALANGAAGFSAINTDVEAILADTGTDGVVLSAATVSQIWAEVIESNNSITAQQAQSIILAACAGVTSSAGAVLEDPSGTNTRITATINASNERTAMTLAPSS